MNNTIKIFTLFVVLGIPSCAGFTVEPSASFTNKEGESFSAKVKIIKNSGK